MVKKRNGLESYDSLRDEQLEGVADLFSVLADATRLRILNLLREGESSVTEIVEKLGMKQPNVSKQLNLLHQSGLVGRRRDGLQIRYRIEQPVVFTLCGAVCDHIRATASEQVKRFG